MAVASVFLALLFPWITPLTGNAQALTESAVPVESSRPLVVPRATDVVHQWQPQQHLYVRGNPGVNAEALAELEQWLDQHATNWVVVLVESADGETYTDAEGETYTGVEAVNHALGKGLMNQTAFSRQVDPRTQERNAAFFILFLKDRQLSYYGSDAQDRRGLGEENWVGELDGPAISAMRNGARVVDAVKDTITNIDRRLEDRIAGEIRARQQRVADAEAARKRALEEAKAALENARADYNLAEASVGEFVRQFPALTGDLVHPDLPGLRAELKMAQSAADEGRLEMARGGAEAVRKQANAIVRLLEQYPADHAKIEELSRRLAHERARLHAPAAATALQAAQEAVDAARREYARGDSSYVPLIQSANASLESVSLAISSATQAAIQRRFLSALAVCAALTGLAVLAFFLNRRRKPVKTEATHFYESWEKALGEKTSALFDLLDRRATLVGTAAEEAAQRYTGETLRLSRQLIQDVDELFIMSSCAGRILQQAQSLLGPSELTARLANLFSEKRYRHALALLRDQPIAFRPEEGIELIVRGARTERDRLIGGLSSYAPFTMTFNELIESFNQRAQRALAALDLVASSLATAPELLQAVQATITEAQSSEARLSEAAEADGLFALEPVFGQLLPQASRTLADAVKLGLTDPVGTLQTDGARARQQADDALALVNVASDARRDSIPIVRECARALTDAGVVAASARGSNGGASSEGDHSRNPPEWLEAGLRQLSGQADAAANQALQSSAADEISAVRQGLCQAELRAKRAVALNQQRITDSQPRIANSTAAIDAARREIASKLGLPPDKTLRERGNDPTDYVAQAQSQAQAALAGLERGDLDAVQSALEAVATLTGQADSIVRASSEAVAAHNEIVAGLRGETQELAAAIPEHTRILIGIQNGYAASVLSLGAGDEAHPHANGTITDNIRETEEHLGAARNLVENAVGLHSQAGVLEAADLLRQAQARLDTGNHRLLEIAEKQRRVTDTDLANQQRLQQLRQRGEECARMAGEPTTMEPTVRAFADASRLLDQAAAAVQATIRDPFMIADQLASLEINLTKVADLARCDRDLYEQAGRSLAAAASQLAQAENLATESLADQVPDSTAIQRARGEVNSLAGALKTAQQSYNLAHGDWRLLDEEATRICNEAAAAIALLRGELARAQAAVAALSAGADRVRMAGGWTGGFGVTVLGTPGADLLTQAHNYLETGDYEAAQHAAENACRLAEQAIAQAEAEVRRRRLAHEQMLEQERRRREAEEQARRRQHTASSWSHSGGSSSSWGRSGSGSRSSSFRSGSGVRTSRW